MSYCRGKYLQGLKRWEAQGVFAGFILQGSSLSLGKGPESCTSNWGPSVTPGGRVVSKCCSKANDYLKQASSHPKIGFKPPEGSAGL